MHMFRSPSVPVAAAALVLLVACGNRTPGAADGQPEPARARAALATLTVDNRTSHNLTILYTLTARAATTVTIGRVDSVDVAVMAPVPAGESILLTARNPGGGVLTLPARSFVIDGEWTWVIAADARFVTPVERRP